MEAQKIVQSPIKYYNNIQLQYFGKKIKKTMVPVYSPYVNKHTEEVIKFGTISKQHKLLDVGCGMGKYTMDLLKKGYHAEGLDLSPFLLQQFLIYNNNNFPLKLHAADILDAPEDLNGQFDRVVGFMTLHHLHEMSASFQSVYRLLKPGGEVIFLEPNPYNPLFHFQIWFTPGMSYAGEKGLLDMKKKKVFEAMRSAGFEAPALQRFGLFPPLLYNHPIGRKIDHAFSKYFPIDSLKAFQLFKATKP